MHRRIILFYLILTGCIFNCAFKDKPSVKGLFALPIVQPQTSTSPLTNITLSSGTLSPRFVASTTSYNASVHNSITQITVTPTTSSTASSITINGVTTSSGIASANIPLTAGVYTIITLAVVGSDSVVYTYTINVYRIGAGAILRFFITDATYNGNLGTPTGADTKCNADINKPNDGTTYKAMLVTNPTMGTVRHVCSSANCAATDYTDWVLNLNTTYVRASDPTVTIFATGGSVRIFVFGTLTNSFESGTQKTYWTGLNNDWTYTNGNSCFSASGWSSGSGLGGQTGVSDSTSNTAINNGQQSCSNLNSLLCVEQ